VPWYPKAKVRGTTCPAQHTFEERCTLGGVSAGSEHATTGAVGLDSCERSVLHFVNVPVVGMGCAAYARCRKVGVSRASGNRAVPAARHPLVSGERIPRLRCPRWRGRGCDMRGSRPESRREMVICRGVGGGPEGCVSVGWKSIRLCCNRLPVRRLRRRDQCSLKHSGNRNARL
jgi:hypothetical protein